MKIKLMVVACAIVVSGLTGCAVMSEQECMTADWYNLGYQDGTAGRGTAFAGERREACSGSYPMNTADYNQGRREGAEVYCTDENGYNVGVSGASVTDICEVSSNRNGFATYLKRGKQVYNARAYLNKIDNDLRLCREYMDDPRLDSMDYMFDANYRYLRNLRNDVVSYVNYVEENAWNGNVQVYDYSRAIKDVPYYRAYEDAKGVIEAYDRIDNALRDIDREIDKQNRCLDDDNASSDRLHHCRKVRDCLRDQKQNLREEKRRLSKDSRYRSRHGDWNDYRRCGR